MYCFNKAVLLSYMRSLLLKKATMRIFTLFLLLSITHISFSQSWCPPGAQWAYQNYGVIGEGSSNLWYAKDTVLNGQACKVIFERFENLGYERLITHYTFEQNDTVFFRWNDKFVPWYFFNASVGDTLTIPAGENMDACDSILYMVVDSTSNMQLQGETLRYYRAHYTDTNAYPKSVQFLEKFGAIDNHLIPVVGCLGMFDFYYFDLGCYEDSSFARYQIDSSITCNYVYLSIEDESAAMGDINVYPNPANTSLSVQANGSIISGLAIFEYLGKLISVENILTDVNQLDISSLPSGMYLLKIQLSNEQYAVKRFVKE